MREVISFDDWTSFLESFSSQLGPVLLSSLGMVFGFFVVWLVMAAVARWMLSDGMSESQYREACRIHGEANRRSGEENAS